MNPQTTFGTEQIVDELAHATGMAPVAFRRQNVATTVASVEASRWLGELQSPLQRRTFPLMRWDIIGSIALAGIVLAATLLWIRADE